MDDAERSWFIDAWAVLDGYAFASLRLPESIESAVTLFLAPPYFEPEPVASLATALAATRGPFQEGFRDTAGVEVAFGSLAQLVEAVRRGYRAGGLHLDGGAMPVVPAPREPGGAGGALHPAELVDDEIRDIWLDLTEVLVSDDGTAQRQERLRSLLTHLLECSLAALIPKFVGYAAVNMLTELSEERPGRSQRAREACAWIDKARALGIHVSVAREPARVITSVIGAAEGFEWSTPELEELGDAFFEFLHPIVYRTTGALVSEQLLSFSVPIPTAFQAGTGAFSYPPIPTLGHLLAAATADRKYVASLHSPHEIVPLLVLALTQLPSTAIPYPAFSFARGTIEGGELCEAAGDWLARALPSAALFEHPAEQAMHELVLRLLSRPNERGEGTPAPLTPEPPPHGGGHSDTRTEPFRELRRNSFEEQRQHHVHQRQAG